MRVGYSIVLSEIVAAGELDYNDCATFQITCPSCREALFKGVRKGVAETHYLSHYRAGSEEARECELRVAAMAQEYLASLGAEARGQTLQKFMSVLRRQICLGQERAGVMSASKLDNMATALIERPDFDRYSVAVRRLITAERAGAMSTRDAIAQTIAELPVFTGRSPFWLRRQASCVLDVIAHLVTDQARANLRYLTACCFVLASWAPERYEIEGQREWDVTNLEMTRRLLRALTDGESISFVRKLEVETLAAARKAKHGKADEISSLCGMTAKKRREFKGMIRDAQRTIRENARELTLLAIEGTVFPVVIGALAAIPFPDLAGAHPTPRMAAE